MGTGMALARPAGGRLEDGPRGMARPGRVDPAGSGSRSRRSGTAAGGPGDDSAGAEGPRWPLGDRVKRGRQGNVVDAYHILSRSFRSRLVLAGGPVTAAEDGSPGQVAASMQDPGTSAGGHESSRVGRLRRVFDVLQSSGVR
ncbi:hypothetical protein HPB50_011957 [Hyalomma asiaticum]|uniref:Uncharacterized protein n=1 Tax=Hyalomma asiaticum TaxID=266040 RepID=A0ACB7T9X0_HYAAI|nr:hypothetical protein HPB50_011957 [Hyalomma asiaticum]